VKSQVRQHFGECCQVTESGVTEPGLQTEAPSAPHSHPESLRSRPLVQVTTLPSRALRSREPSNSPADLTGGQGPAYQSCLSGIAFLSADTVNQHVRRGKRRCSVLSHNPRRIARGAVRTIRLAEFGTELGDDTSNVRSLPVRKQ
jgi:hypothetical protein